MLERHVFVAVLVRQRQRAAERLFERGEKDGTSSYSFSIVHCSGCSCRRAKSSTWATLVSATS